MRVAATFARFWGIWVPGVSDRVLVVDAGSVLSPAEKFSPGRIIIRNGRVDAVGLISDLRLPENAEHVDALRFTVVPGFIDPHIHGSAGIDVMDATFPSMNTISRILASHGTTSFLPTTVSASPEILGNTLDRLSTILQQSFEGATPIGIHLEGPFISEQKRGTHRANNVCFPDQTLLSDWIRRAQGKLKLVTMAPELDGAHVVARFARTSGVTVAMGHSNASFHEAMAAAEDGTHYAVHTFNAMRAFNHRNSGIAGAVLSDDRVYAEIIADGIHVSPEVVRIFARSKGRERILLVTDAISATGMPDGKYALGTNEVQVHAGICRDDDGRLAGSTLTQDAALRNFIAYSGMRMEDTVFGLTLNPARALKLEGRGCIEPEAHADLVMLNNELRVMKTFVEGRLVFEGRS
jgi:N-acetylglucosamine-6-phosphate deacetylase